MSFIKNIVFLLIVFFSYFFTDSLIYASDKNFPFGLTTSFYFNKRKSKKEMRTLREKFIKGDRKAFFKGIPYDKPPYSTAIKLGIEWERPTHPVLDWIIVQPNKEYIKAKKYDWTVPDNFLSRIPKGLNILVTINVNPNFLIPGTWDFTNSSLKNDYTIFVKKVVERYNGDGKNDMPGLKNPVKYWQVENEPDHRGHIKLPFFKKRITRKHNEHVEMDSMRYNNVPLSKKSAVSYNEPFHKNNIGYDNDLLSKLSNRKNLSKGYAEIVKITSNAIKSIDKNAKVVLGGMSSQPSQINIKILNNFFLPVINELRKGDIDVVDFHWFVSDVYESYQVYKSIRNTLDKKGFTNVDIWMTETGVSSEKSEEYQAIQLIKRFIYPIGYGVKKVFWAWGLVEGLPPFNCKSIFDYTGLIYDGKCPGDQGYGVKKLAFYSYMKMIKKLRGSQWNNVNMLNNGENGIYIYKFPQQLKNVYIVWHETKNEKIVLDFKIPKGSEYIVTESIPKKYNKKIREVKSSSSELIDKYFKTTNHKALSNTISITLSDIPLYLEVKKK